MLALNLRHPSVFTKLLQDFVLTALYLKHLAKIVLVGVCTFRDLLALVNCYSYFMVSLFVNNAFLMLINIFLYCKWK